MCHYLNNAVAIKISCWYDRCNNPISYFFSSLDSAKADALIASMDSNNDKALTFSEMAWVVAGSQGKSAI